MKFGWLDDLAGTHTWKYGNRSLRDYLPPANALVRPTAIPEVGRGTPKRVL